jgi:uncharacterized membrane protein YfhO
MFSALKIFLATENKKRAAYTLLLSAMSAVLIGCVILLPCYFALNSSVRQSGIFHNVINGNPYDVNTYHFGALQTKITYLMCGAVALPSILLYLFDIKKHGRKGVFLLAALLLSLLPAFIEPVNVMWHFGSYALFPLRHGFIACFMLLFLSAAAFESIDFKYNDDAKPLLKNLASLALCLLAFCAFCYLFNGILNKYKSEIILSSYYFEVTQKAFKGIVILYLAAGAAYFLVMLAVRFKFLRIRMAAAVLALIAVAEAAANFDMFVASKKVGNDVFVSRIQLGEELNKTDGGYYRVKDHYLFDRHNFSLISGNSFNHYTSLTNRYAENALVKLGYTQSWFWISNMSGTVFSDSLLSHKYVISKEPIPNTYLEHTGQTADYQIYQNPYSFDMGIITKSGAFDGGDLTPVKYQNALYKHITGDDLFVFYDYSDTPNLNVKTKNGATYFRGFGGRIIYEIYVEGRQTLYFDIDTPYTLCLNVSVNDEDLVYSYPSSENNGILELGTFEDEDVSIELNLNMDIFAYDIELAGLPLDKMTALNNFVTTADGFNYGDGKYTITADNAEAGSFLTLSVPYDKGFTCYVNGKKRDIEITCGGFICVALDEGDNVVELKYFPPGMALGIAAAAAGIALLILTGFLFKRQNAPAINICYYIYAAAAALAAFIMVVFPLAAFIVKLFI